MLCRVGDMSRHVAGLVGNLAKCRVCKGVQNDSLHVGNSCELKQKKIIIRYTYVWADLYLLAVIDINWVCWGLCVATTRYVTRYVGEKLATLTRVGNMWGT
jgi:hypothetical protein